ncbi:hypothetical protein ACET3X_003719 [Alternaria dauci]|uniref:Uncharacterized protein n=1 Tax=Alternaria dauci TaxID=48095 RepID=A0ABR3UM34_9PLEO
MSDWDPYSFSASRSSAYKVLLTVAATLTIIRKKLPPAAHRIYRGYYDDIINAEVRASESALEMATFVENFPAILRFHNRVAVLQNPEIEGQKPGEGRVKFPVVGNGVAAGDDNEDVIEATLTQQKHRNKPKWEAERAKKGNIVAAPEETLATVPNFALDKDAEPEPETSEESVALAHSPTIATTEADAPAVTQSPATSPASPANPESESLGMSRNDSEVIEELPDAPGPVGDQNFATLPAFPTTTDTEDSEEYENGNGLQLEPLEDIWDDSIWPHGDWAPGYEVMDTISWAQPR